ncbi:hypothetical protein Poly30_05630 [Planctomycetes bacterium Poly30]|uniref:Uncharacterized protein n=1 Tax=Saltatorellus ferox TaxID=2528018 RepID=A0A518ELV9_9BACT|nr:hypothetical protein Poly30_05630 [Planctomycetes bacterium Poly30]
MIPSSGPAGPSRRLTLLRVAALVTSIGVAGFLVMNAQRSATRASETPENGPTQESLLRTAEDPAPASQEAPSNHFLYSSKLLQTVDLAEPEVVQRPVFLPSSKSVPIVFPIEEQPVTATLPGAAEQATTSDTIREGS